MHKISYKNYHRDNDYLDNEKLFKNIFLKRYGIISKYAKKKGRVLEIGCSNGIFLDIFKKNGWQTYGVEPSVNAKKAIGKGHKILRTYFEKTSYPQNFFDAVVMNHTLEHTDDPGLVLQKIYKISKKGGIIFIDVPNAGSLSARILGKYWPLRLPLEHKWQFTKNSLSKEISKSGFKILHWESRSGIFEYGKPYLELWRSLTGLKKRFFEDILSLPYSILVTLINMGDSMSFVAKK